MENKGYQAGFRDFDKQMGVEPKKSDNLLSWNRGDGGTHGTLSRLKHTLVTTPDIYSSFRNAISTPETWHSKATKLNSSASNHYGPAASPDPSSLSRSSNAANMKRPTDLKKCDFFPTSRSMSMIWDARVFDCWRLVLGCDDLLSRPASSASAMPARQPMKNHWTKQSRTKPHLAPNFPRVLRGLCRLPAVEPYSDTDMPGLDDIPHDQEPPSRSEGLEPTSDGDGPGPSPETPTTPEPNESTAESNKEPEEGPKFHKEPAGFDGNRVLSNAILFLMEFGWWIELNYEIPEGDVGRVFEILKIFIFTFAGSSNQNYMRYMLDLYALLEFECSPDLKEVLLNNWLLTLREEIGNFVEGDLMQEWNIRWLTNISGQRRHTHSLSFKPVTFS
ncbi:hypothetical protein B0H13DRAFT_2337376 [Mycena leptocephala]|nr:hypothetical protein B0H13DRAFT_2337376 [Mycena leptocephala]